MKRKIKQIRGGFTLVELLTVLAVIGVLLGLLIPALNQVSKTATKVKQKAQFNAIGTALEAFRNDYGDYPPSAWNSDPVTGYGSYSASQRLAEALIGRDGFGFHPSSQWKEDGTIIVKLPTFPPGEGPVNVYSAAADQPGWQTAEENLACRKGSYLEIESANAVKLANIPEAGGSLPAAVDSYVLADMYKIVKNTATGKDVGMPILYYKANKFKVGLNPASSSYDELAENTYNLNDSICRGVGFLNMSAANIFAFYKAIANPNFTSPPRPYRAESFILHSAGPDGAYGTADDIFNFDQDK